MNYDVPRPSGLYWVIWLQGDEPTVAEFEVMLYGSVREWLYKSWLMLGTDDAPPCPDRVICRAWFPAHRFPEFAP